ncbi:Lamb1 [Symbiodinium sp. KB8]|nr:Lamb1 [Symbiodinium sp. KB8]
MKTKHKNAMREVAEKFEKVDSETRQQYNVYVAAIQKRAEEKFEAYKQRLAKLEAENADLANAVLEVEGKHKRELASYDAKKAQEYEELERSLSAKIELLQQELATIRSEKGEAEKAIELLEPAVRAREASIMSLEQEKRAIAEALKELASQTPANAVAAAEMEKVVQEKQAIEEQLKRANNAKAAAEKELVEAKQALSSLQNGQVANAAATAASMQGESVTVEAEPRTSAAPVPVSAGTSRSGASSEDLEKAESRAIAAEAQLAAISSQVKLLEGNRVEAVSRAEAIYQQLQKAIVDAVAASADANRSNDQNEEALLSAIEQAGRLNEATQGYEAVLARYSKQREEEENIRTRHKELKAEIKTWLSEFKEKNGREPTKDDKRAIKGT